MATVCRPLTTLTRKDRQQFSGSECEEAFSKVKELLVSAPLLHPPKLDKEFYLWTDASEQGFGAVLEQENEGGIRHPIAYASRPTNSAEMKCAPTELEVATLVFALEHFRVYLLGNRVTVYTDHQAWVSSFILYLKSQTKGPLARWYLRLSPFLPNISLQHCQSSCWCFVLCSSWKESVTCWDGNSWYHDEIGQRHTERRSWIVTVGWLFRTQYLTWRIFFFVRGLTALIIWLLHKNESFRNPRITWWCVQHWSCSVSSLLLPVNMEDRENYTVEGDSLFVFVILWIIPSGQLSVRLLGGVMSKITSF